eukprot:CFRG1836T1
MSITEEQCVLIRESWKEVSHGGKPLEFKALRLVMDFYSNLFELAPETKILFKENMANQGRALVGMLDIVVNHIDALASIKSDVEDLGVRHKKYGVKSNMYITAGRALVQALSTRLPQDDSAVPYKIAWMQAYAFLSSLMCAAAGSKVPMWSIKAMIDPAALPESDFKRIVRTRKNFEAHLKASDNKFSGSKSTLYSSHSVTSTTTDGSTICQTKKKHSRFRMFFKIGKVA